MNQRTGNKQVLAVAGCVLLLSPLLAYLTIAFEGGNTFLFEDGLLYSFPLRVFLHEAYHQGFSPQWMPYSACGFSLLAEGQSGLCFPVTQILYRVFPAPSGWLLEMMAQHLVAFLCSALLLRHLGLGRFPALFGASVYAFCPVATMCGAMVPSLTWCYVLLPALLWATARFLEGRPRASVPLLAVVTLILLTGHPVMILYVGMVAFAFAVYEAARLWPQATGLRGAGVRTMVLILLVVLAVLIALPQWLPMLQQLPFSARTAPTSGSLDVRQNTLHLDLAWVFLALFPSPFDWSGGQYWAIYLRYPFFVYFLALVGVVFGIKERHHWYFIGLIFFVILMALGPHVGLWKLVHSLPVLNSFRFPFRWLFFFPLCISLLAAFGLDRLLGSRGAVLPRWLRRALRLGLCAVVAAEVMAVLTHPQVFLPSAFEAFQSRPWLTGLLWTTAAGMVLTAWWATRRGTGRRPVAVGVGLTIVALWALSAFHLSDSHAVRHLETIGWKWNPLPAATRQYRLSSSLPPYAAWESNRIGEYYRYTPNLSLLAGRLTTDHYCSFIPYWSADVSTWCQETLRGLGAHEKILDISSAAWLVSPDMSSAHPASVQERANPRAAPRARIVLSSILCADDKELIRVLQSPEFEPQQVVALLAQDRESLDPAPRAGAAAARVPLPVATILVDRPDRIEIALEPAAPGGSWLVLSDTYYPGWKALVDGVEERILRANYAFRGVQLPEGAKRVVFIFDPFIPDALLALPTIVLMALGIVSLLLPRSLVSAR